MSTFERSERTSIFLAAAATVFHLRDANNDVGDESEYEEDE